MDFLLAEREFVEALVEPAGLPTRTEIDEVHRTVQELKRRVASPGEGRRTPGPPQSPNPEATKLRRSAAQGTSTRREQQHDADVHAGDTRN